VPTKLTYIHQIRCGQLGLGNCRMEQVQVGVHEGSVLDLQGVGDEDDADTQAER
jgi:hypothetical protein